MMNKISCFFKKYRVCVVLLSVGFCLSSLTLCTIIFKKSCNPTFKQCKFYTKQIAQVISTNITKIDKSTYHNSNINYVVYETFQYNVSNEKKDICLLKCDTFDTYDDAQNYSKLLSFGMYRTVYVDGSVCYNNQLEHNVIEYNVGIILAVVSCFICCVFFTLTYCDMYCADDANKFEELIDV